MRRGALLIAVLTLGLALGLTACSPDPATDRSTPDPDERLSAVAAMANVDVRGYERAVEPRVFVFPEDHGPHPGFKLEWWYFTGNLTAISDGGEGRRFGYQLTFFRQALAPEEDSRDERASDWATRQLVLAHFALSDLDGERFHSFERVARGGAGLAGAEAEPFRVWLEDWRVESTGEAFLPLRLVAEAGDVALDLRLDSTKPIVLQGDDGLSQKSAEPGNASYYYSLTRMPARGTVETSGEVFEVAGNGWLDREWSTSGLDAGQKGWDWLALQLDDGTDLMFYQLRLEGDEVEPLSHGALIAPDGTKNHLALDDVELEVTDTWTSPDGGTYPAGWRLRIPGAGLDLEVEPLLANQELDVTFRYWEGAVGVRGRHDGREVAGRGYVELVGYGD